MTWKKQLLYAGLAILVFYVLVKMSNRSMFSAADLQSIYTDALAKRQQQIELRYRKATVRIVEINAALVLASVASAKKTEELKKIWEKTLHDTKIRSINEKNKLTFTNEQLYQECINRDIIIATGKETIDRLINENGKIRNEFSKNTLALDTAWKEKLKIVGEDRDFWKKESERWNKKYLNRNKWEWIIRGISVGVGFVSGSSIKR